MRGCNLHQDMDTSALQCPGPLTRHAADLTLVLRVLAGDRATQLSLGKKVRPVTVVSIVSGRGELRGCWEGGGGNSLFNVKSC